jgi:hypothetical protein
MRDRGRVKDIALEIPAVATDRLDTDVDIAKLQARSLEGQVGTTMGQLTATGEIAKLSDPRFAHSVSEGGLWRPFDFIVSGYAGCTSSSATIRKRYRCSSCTA